MKKLAFTIATVAAFSFANAQEIQQPTQTPTKKTTATPDKKEGATKKTATADGTSMSTGTTENNTNSSTSTEPKKSGTRMAINEKGLPGEKKPAKSSTNSNPK